MVGGEATSGEAADGASPGGDSSGGASAGEEAPVGLRLAAVRARVVTLGALGTTR